MKRLVLLLVPFLLLAGLVVAPSAQATPGVVWYVRYGSAYTSNSPNVWSNRSPTWSVGSDPYLYFSIAGDLVDAGLTTCNGVCWHSGTANAGPGPWQAYWDSRPGTSGDFRIYSHDSIVRFHTNTANTSDALMIFYENGCLDLYSHAGGNWGWPIWVNSASSACSIYH